MFAGGGGVAVRPVRLSRSRSCSSSGVQKPSYCSGASPSGVQKPSNWSGASSMGGSWKSGPSGMLELRMPTLSSRSAGFSDSTSPPTFLMIERSLVSSKEILELPLRRCFSISRASPSVRAEILRARFFGTINLGIIGRSRPGLPSNTIPSVSASTVPVTSTKDIPGGAARSPPLRRAPIFGPRPLDSRSNPRPKTKGACIFLNHHPW